MKKKCYFLPIIMLMMLIYVACTPEGNKEQFFDSLPQVKDDLQLPITIFLANIPEDYAEFKELLEYAFIQRETALEQELGNTDVTMGFRKITYLYPSTDISGNAITLSAVAF